MKKILLIITAIFITISCSIKTNVRELALENKADGGDVQEVINLYTRCYYTVPQNREDIISFLRKYKEARPEEFIFFDSNVDGGDYIGLVEKEKILVEAYRDSAFFYFPKRHFGSCVYSLYYWILHPEKYENLDYDMMFFPSVFKNNGDYYFSYNHKALSTIIDGFLELFDSIVLTQGYDNRFNVGDGGSPILVPMRIIATYEVTKDTLYMTSDFPAQKDSIAITPYYMKTETEEYPDYLKFLDSLGGIKRNPEEMKKEYTYLSFDENDIKLYPSKSINLDSLKNQLLERIAPKIKEVVHQDPLIDKIIFPIYLYCNTK